MSEHGAITSSLVEAFERAVYALTNEPQFKDVEFLTTRARTAGRTTAFVVVVDTPNGVDLRLCERVAARINAALEERTEQYSLEVESPGLDRPLVRPSDYERFRGHRVRVQTTLAVNGAKTHRGVLAGVRGSAILLTTEHGELPIPIQMVKAANLDVDIRADLAREKRERRRS